MDSLMGTVGGDAFARRTGAMPRSTSFSGAVVRGLWWLAPRRWIPSWEPWAETPLPGAPERCHGPPPSQGRWYEAYGGWLREDGFPHGNRGRRRLCPAHRS